MQPGEPPEKVLAEQALRQRGRNGADREVDLPGCGELACDLPAGVAGADHQYRHVGQLRRVPVLRGVQLGDRLAQSGRHRWYERLLERAGGHDDLASGEDLVTCSELEELLGAAESINTAVQSDREAERAGV